MWLFNSDLTSPFSALSRFSQNVSQWTWMQYIHILCSYSIHHRHELKRQRITQCAISRAIQSCSGTAEPVHLCMCVRTYLPTRTVPTLLRSSCSYLRTRRHIRDGEEYFLLITRLERPLSLSLYYDLGVEYIPLFYFFNIRRSLYLGVSKISSSRREL